MYEGAKWLLFLPVHFKLFGAKLSQERAAPDPVDGSERPHYWALPSVAHLRERFRQAQLEGIAGRRRRGACIVLPAELSGLFVTRILVESAKRITYGALSAWNGVAPACAGMVARNDMVSQYDGAVVAIQFVHRVEHLVEEGKRKADEEVAAAQEQDEALSSHVMKVT